jgi:hypothetical protein
MCHILTCQPCRCDIGLALSSGGKTILFSDAFWEPFIPFPDERVIPSMADRTGPAPLVAMFSDDSDPELSRTWLFMQEFCYRVNLASRDRQRLPLRMFLVAMASVMYRILHKEFEAGSYNEALRLGLLAFTSQIFLYSDMIKLVHKDLAEMFRNCARNFDIVDTDSAHFVPWLLITMGSSAFVETTSEWFMPLLHAKLKLTRVTCWQELLVILRSFLWIDHLQDKPARDIYAALMAWRQGHD